MHQWLKNMAMCIIVGVVLILCKPELLMAKTSMGEAAAKLPEFAVSELPAEVSELMAGKMPVKASAYAVNDLPAENVERGIAIQIGDSVKETQVLDGKFVKKKGALYFQKTDGKRVKKQFFTYNKNVYRVDAKGAVVTGWLKEKGNYYFFGRSTGKLRRGGKADQIKISKKGVAKASKTDALRIQTYIKAQKIVAQVSKPSDSKRTKLYKCYKWLEKFPYKQFRTMRTAKAGHPKDWDVVFANDIFEEHKGCCASEACAFAYLAKSCGYKNVTICSDTGHAWVDIGGRLYDPLFAEARSFSKNYNARYWDYRVRSAYVKKL